MSEPDNATDNATAPDDAELLLMNIKNFQTKARFQKMPMKAVIPNLLKYLSKVLT